MDLSSSWASFPVVNFSDLSAAMPKVDFSSVVTAMSNLNFYSSAVAAMPRVDFSSVVAAIPKPDFYSSAVAAIPKVDLSSVVAAVPKLDFYSSAVAAIPKVDFSSVIAAQPKLDFYSSAVAAIPKVDFSSVIAALPKLDFYSSAVATIPKVDFSSVFAAMPKLDIFSATRAMLGVTRSAVEWPAVLMTVPGPAGIPDARPSWIPKEVNRLLLLLERRGLDVLRQHVLGAVDAAESKSVDRWCHCAISTRLLITGVLLRVAPQKHFKVVAWVRANYPHEINQNGLPTHRGRVHYALRYVQLEDYPLGRVEELAQLLGDANEALHTYGYTSGPLYGTVSGLIDQMKWFLAAASDLEA